VKVGTLRQHSAMMGKLTQPTFRLKPTMKRYYYNPVGGDPSYSTPIRMTFRLSSGSRGLKYGSLARSALATSKARTAARHRRTPRRVPKTRYTNNNVTRSKKEKAARLCKKCGQPGHRAEARNSINPADKSKSGMPWK
jgi:hypothetical protein